MVIEKNASRTVANPRGHRFDWEWLGRTGEGDNAQPERLVNLLAVPDHAKPNGRQRADAVEDRGYAVVDLRSGRDLIRAEPWLAAVRIRVTYRVESSKAR